MGLSYADGRDHGRTPCGGSDRQNKINQEVCNMRKDLGSQPALFPMPVLMVVVLVYK